MAALIQRSAQKLDKSSKEPDPRRALGQFGFNEIKRRPEVVSSDEFAKRLQQVDLREIKAARAVR
jgi:hypothetical protein